MIFKYITCGHTNDLALSGELISLLANMNNRTQQEVLTINNEKVCTAITYINKYFYKKINIEYFAKMLCMSTSRFAHVFKDIMGVSPYTYILNLRMEKASELLALSNVPISDVAYNVGFDNPLYFSKAFKKHFGVSPTVFRSGDYKNIKTRTNSSGCD